MGLRALAWALILYGVLGLALAISGAAVGLDMAARVERLAADADGTLAAAARATRAAAESFDNVDASLTNAEDSSVAAAALARDASGTLRSLAVAMDLAIFGSRPLLPLAEEFATSADQAATLAETLDAVGGSLGDTRTDTAVVGTQLGLLADRLEAVGDPGAGGGTPAVRLFVGILLVWLLMPALGSLVAGLALLRRTRVVVVNAGPPAGTGASGRIGP